MNNEYDRGTEEGPRYTMSSFSKDLAPLIDIKDDVIECEPNLTMFLLVDGTTIISEYRETIPSDSYILDNPLQEDAFLGNFNQNLGLNCSLFTWCQH